MYNGLTGWVPCLAGLRLSAWLACCPGWLGWIADMAALVPRMLLTHGIAFLWVSWASQAR
eukprot:496257-Karenia_brevis.AAC.1